MENQKDLLAIHDPRKSFYGKAWTYEEEYTEDPRVGKVLYLVSYQTVVACIHNGYPQVLETFSDTTLRHIKEFLIQNGWKAETKKQILHDYNPDDSEYPFHCHRIV